MGTVLSSSVTRAAWIAGLMVVFGCAAGAQTSATFPSGGRTVAIERFDPTSQGDHAAVMLVHGAGGVDGGWRKSGIIEALTEAGYSVFVPHYFDAGGAWDNS